MKKIVCFLKTPEKRSTIIFVALVLWIIYPFFDIWTFWELDQRWMNPEYKLHGYFYHNDKGQWINAATHFPWGNILLAGIGLNLIILPLWILLFWFCLRKYQGNLPLWVWDKKRPWRSAVLTILFLSAFLVALQASLIEIVERIPPYGVLILAWACLLLHLRASVVGKFIDQSDR